MRVFGQQIQNVSLNTDSDPYYEIFARTTLQDFVNGTVPRASLKEMLETRIILDDMDRLASENK